MIDQELGPSPQLRQRSPFDRLTPNELEWLDSVLIERS